MSELKHIEDDIVQIRAEQVRMDNEQRHMKGDIVELKTNYQHTKVALTKIESKLDTNAKLTVTTLISVVIGLTLYVIKGL
jgi:predicted  nucleic acid-binding Zn-ribbon protein